MFQGFDILLLLIALLIMLLGWISRIFLFRKGRPESCQGSFQAVIFYLLYHKKILKRFWAGLNHYFFILGVLVPLCLIIMSQFGFNVRASNAVILSILTDLLGLTMISGVIFFLARWVKREPSERPEKVFFPLIVITLIVFSGFLAEATRMSIVEQEWPWASPVGWMISFMMPDSPLFMQLMIRIHFIGVCLLLASLPFTFMRHIATASLNVYHQGQEKKWVPRDVPFEKKSVGAAKPEDMTWKQLLEIDACVSCNRCEENCPAFQSDKPLSPKMVVRKIFNVMVENRKISKRLLEELISEDEIWSCTTCFACVEHCPVYVLPMDKIIELRRHLTMGKGALPHEAKPIIRNLELLGDTYGKGKSNRMEWAVGLYPPIELKNISNEILLWVGCSGAFHPRYIKVVRSMIRILDKSGVKYSLLGNKECCCGDPARRLGDERLFLDLANRNIQTFRKWNVKKIVVLCPHCLQVLKNEYSTLGCELDVIHGTELVASLVEKKRIKLKYSVGEQITVHDPCYLGRMNKIYEPMRKIIHSLPDSELIEAERNYDKSFCCGGGGGRMWLHEGLGHKINHIRSEEMIKTGADMVGTACPYCLTMLEDGIKSLELEKEPKLLDVLEIVESAMEL